MNSKIKQVLKKYRLNFIIMSVMASASAFLTSAGPLMLGNATSVVFEGIMAKLSGTGRIDFNKVSGILCMLMGICLLSAALAWIADWIMAGIAAGVSGELKNAMLQKLQLVTLSAIEQQGAGQILARITAEADAAGSDLAAGVKQLVTSLTSIAGICIMMLYISPVLAGLAVLIFPVSVAVLRMILHFSRKSAVQYSDYAGELQNRTEEFFSGHTVLKLYGREHAAAEAFRQLNGRLYQASLKNKFYAGTAAQTMNLLSNIGYVAIALAGGRFALQGQLRVGDIQAFIHYIRILARPIRETALAAGRLQNAGILTAGAGAFLILPEETDGRQCEAGKAVDPEKATYKICFSHVTFGYREDRTVLSDFSLNVSRGDHVAVVGQTGSGKTTLTNLMLGFYHADSGTIYIDGTDVRSLDPEELRSRFGVVLQDTWLFEGTVLDNIRYGKPDATEQETIEAAKTAYAHPFIEALPYGYHTRLTGGGRNLSKGQRQLIAIARAVLTDPEIFIFDEATSSVDTETEALIRQAIGNLMRDKTCFIIAHRESTIRGADRVIIIDEENHGGIGKNGSEPETESGTEIGSGS